MNTRVWLWAFWGIPGVREIVLVALVTLVLYGRSGMQIARRGGGLPPWLSPFVRRTRPSATRANANASANSTPVSGTSRREDRIFWFLAILAATAVAAWIVTRTMIVAAPSLSD
jgi:hypothetical protein